MNQYRVEHKDFSSQIVRSRTGRQDAVVLEGIERKKLADSVADALNAAYMDGYADGQD